MKLTDKEKIVQYAKIMRSSADKILEILEKTTLTEESHIERVPSKYVPDWDDWPDAVPDFLISDITPAGIIKRAQSVLNMCDITDLTGKNFLDFGCGDGSMVKEAVARGAKVAQGYDIVKGWGEQESYEKQGYYLCNLYSALEKIFDVILLYDVLDHSENPIVVLQQVRKLISEKGEVKVRCHPYTSKHANHVYRTFNKAYSHFFLTPEELAEHNPESVLKMTGVNPLEEYKKWFNNSGFEIRGENVHRNPLDKACTKNIPRQALRFIVNHENYQEILQIQFVDYTLTPR